MHQETKCCIPSWMQTSTCRLTIIVMLDSQDARHISLQHFQLSPAPLAAPCNALGFFGLFRFGLSVDMGVPLAQLKRSTSPAAPDPKVEAKIAALLMRVARVLCCASLIDSPPCLHRPPTWKGIHPNSVLRGFLHLTCRKTGFYGPEIEH